MKNKVISVGLLILMMVLITSAESDYNQKDDEFLEIVERSTFEYFWKEANPSNGLIKDRSTSDAPSSIAAVGFGLSAICIAESRGWINYEEAYNRTLTTLKTFNDTIPNKEGFFYHFINMSTGAREWNSELSSIDTALLMAGVLHAGEHFKGTEIENLSIKLYERVNWTWMLNGGDTLSMGWKPESGFLPYRWEGYNEAMILYLLAIGSPTHPIPNSSWHAWAKTYKWGCGKTIDDFEEGNVRDWVTFKSTNAFINISSSDNIKIGNYSMRIDYNTAGEYVGVYKALNTWANYDRVSLWLYGDNSNNTLEIKLEERDGEHWVDKPIINWTGWKKLNISTSSFKVENIRNGILDKSKVSRFTIAISGNNSSNSIIYIDGIELPYLCNNGKDFIYSGSLFTYQYSHAWIDFRCKRDAYADYWQNSINAVKENRLFCIDNRDTYPTYGENSWGLTASDGPWGYKAYGSCPSYNHDGTIAPTGAGGSVALAPDLAIPALRFMYTEYGDQLWGKYGFKDAFNLDTDLSTPGNQEWWDEDYIGIDEGAIILSIENYRSGLVWKEFMQNKYIIKAMKEVGFVVTGDFNLNGKVDIQDVEMVAFMVIGIIPDDPEADFNNNNRVDIGDLAKIAYYVAGKIDLLCDYN